MDNGTTTPDPDSYRQALANGLLAPFTGGYVNPQFATPTQISEMRKAGATIAAPMQVHRPMEGIANIVKALVGGNMEYQADQIGQQAYATDLGAAARVAQAARGADTTAAPGGSVPATGSAPSPGFDSAVNWTLGQEGGLNAKDTNGTPSNYGINQAAHPDIDVTKLTADGAKGIYKSDYWDSIGADKMSPPLARAAFDTAVMSGPQVAKQMVAQSGGDPNKFMQLREQMQSNLLQQDPAKYGPYAQAWATRNAGLRSDIAALSSGGASPGSQGGQPTAQAAPTQGNPLAFLNTPVPGAYPAGASANPLARGLLSPTSASGGASPADLARVLMSPFSSAEAKDMAKSQVVPTILHDFYGGYDAYRPGDPSARNIQRGTHFAPLSTPDVSTETATQDGGGGPPTTRLTVPAVPAQSANGGAPQQPGGSAAPAAPAGPLAGLAPLVGDAQQLHAQGLQTNAQAGDDVSRINAYSADGVRAKGALAQLNAIDAAGQQAPTGVAAKLQEVLGHYGIDAGKLGPLESYQSAIDAFAPNNPVAGQFKAALGSMLATPEGRQAAVGNMKLLAQYQQQIGDIASDRSLPYSARMLKIQNLGQPQLTLPPQQPPAASDPISPYRTQPAAQPPALSGRFAGADDALAQARAAVAAGKPRAAVEQRLRQVGIDPSGL